MTNNPKPLPPLGPNERPNLTPEQIEWLLAQPVPMKKRKMLHVEVSERTFKAVKERPEELKLIAKDEHDNVVTERPHRPRVTGTIREDEVGHAEYERIRQESMGKPNLVHSSPTLPGKDHVIPLSGGDPPDQHWTRQRTWTGEERYRPSSGRNEYVVSDYDIFAVLRSR